MSELHVLFALFAALQVADAITTLVVLRHGGREANPLMRALMERTGVALALVTTKTLLLVAIWLWLMNFYLLTAGVVLYGVVVGWNASNAKRAIDNGL